MSISVACACGKKYRVRDELAGKRAKCQACGQTFTVPQPAAAVAPLLDDLDPDELTQGSPLDRPLGASPLRASKRKNANHLPLIAGIIGGVVAVLVLVLLIVVLWPSGNTVSETTDRTVATAPLDEPSESADNVPSPKRSKPAPSPPRSTDDAPDTAPPRAPAQTVSVDVSTNVHGATFVVRDVAGKQEVQPVTLKGGQTNHQFVLEADGEYEFEARIANEVVKRGSTGADRAGQVALNFDPRMVREICRTAVCVIRLPEGGHGSGFLFGDRQTVVTTAHVLVTRRVEEVELIFNPAEDKEIRLTGSQLIYLDAKQDVAVLRLAQPVAVERPFLWHLKGSTSGENRFDVQSQFLVIGNPGRGDDYDPLYIRKAKVVGGRPDEFQLDIELKPGYSGGPVCRADTGQVAGLVSYKIVGGVEYKDVGKSFAKSADIADDAITNWTSMDSQRQQDRVQRLSDQFARQYGYRCAFNAGLNVLFDSAVYTGICVSVVADYQNYMAKEMAEIDPRLRPASIRKKVKEAHRTYIKDRGPEKAKEVRDEVTPKLREETEKWYGEAIADETLPESFKEQLKNAHEQYEYLKGAAEQIVDPKGSVGGGKTVDEFLELVLKSWGQASEYSKNAVDAAVQHLEQAG